MHGQGRSDIYPLGPEQITLTASSPGAKVSQQAKLDCVDNYTNIYHFFIGFIKGTLKPIHISSTMLSEIFLALIFFFFAASVKRKTLVTMCLCLVLYLFFFCKYFQVWTLNRIIHKKKTNHFILILDYQSRIKSESSSSWETPQIIAGWIFH